MSSVPLGHAEYETGVQCAARTLGVRDRCPVCRSDTWSTRQVSSVPLGHLEYETGVQCAARTLGVRDRCPVCRSDTWSTRQVSSVPLGHLEYETGVQCAARTLGVRDRCPVCRSDTWSTRQVSSVPLGHLEYETGIQCAARTLGVRGMSARQVVFEDEPTAISSEALSETTVVDQVIRGVVRQLQQPTISPKLDATPTSGTCFTCGGRGHRARDFANKRRRSPSASLVLSVPERATLLGNAPTPCDGGTHQGNHQIGDMAAGAVQVVAPAVVQTLKILIRIDEVTGATVLDDDIVIVRAITRVVEKIPAIMTVSIGKTGENVHIVDKTKTMITVP